MIRSWNLGKISKFFTTALALMFLLVATSGGYAAETKAKSAAPTSKASEKKTVDAEAAVAKSIENYSISGTLDEVFGQVEKMGKVVVYIDWDGLEAAGIKKTKRVSVAGKNHTLRQVIGRLIIKSANRGKPLGWLIHENVIIVTSQPRAMTLRKRLREIGKTPVGSKQTQKLKKTVAGKTYKFDFDDVPLSDVMDYFRELTKVNLHVNWKALEVVGVDKSTPITLKAEGISITKGLDLVLSGINSNKDKMASVYWVIDGGVLEVSTGAMLNRVMRTRVYQAASMLQVIPDTKGQRAKISAIGQKLSDDSWDGSYDNIFDNDEEQEEESISKQRKQARAALISIIKNSIGEDMWDPIGKGSIRIFKKRLVITQSLLGFKLMEKSLR